MPIKVQKTIHEINSEVDILAVKELDWGFEIIARVTDTGSVGSAEGFASQAAALAFSQQNNISEDVLNRTKIECILPAANEENVWYTHIKISRKK